MLAMMMPFDIHRFKYHRGLIVRKLSKIRRAPDDCAVVHHSACDGVLHGTGALPNRLDYIMPFDISKFYCVCVCVRVQNFQTTAERLPTVQSCDMQPTMTYAVRHWYAAFPSRLDTVGLIPFDISEFWYL